jgi:hypothetical protein
MNREEILNYIIETKLVENYTKKLANSDDWEQIEDITQEIYLQICEIPEDKLIELYNQGTEKDPFKSIRGYVTGLIYRNVKSKNSKVWTKLKKHYTREFIQDSDEWDIFENIPDIQINEFSLEY